MLHFPDCRIKERGFEVLDGGEAILTLDVKEMRRFDVEQFLQMLPGGAPLEIDGEKCVSFLNFLQDMICRPTESVFHQPGGRLLALINSARDGISNR